MTPCLDRAAYKWKLRAYRWNGPFLEEASLLHISRTGSHHRLLEVIGLEMLPTDYRVGGGFPQCHMWSNLDGLSLDCDSPFEALGGNSIENC